MDLSIALIQEHSRQNMSAIAGYIGTDVDKFAELMTYILHGKDKYPQFASWVMTICAEKAQDLFVPYISQLLPLLKETKVHDGVKRNIVRTLQFCELPEALQGDIYEACFSLFNNPKETIAVRAFAMTVLHRIALYYPELAPELCETIKQHSILGSSGFKHRAKEILEKWEK